MRVIAKADEMSQFVNEARAAGKKIAFVPTMGALHEGHLALMREARRHGEVVVVSVFVNPRQFNDPGDFEKYARDPGGDLGKCESAGVDAVFAPSVEEMYPRDDPAPEIPLPAVARPLEGAFRPGHFEGVVAVVSRLFRIVEPDAAVFGLKDYQQVRVIEDMVASSGWSVRIVRHPTVREKDGLAMSSRNARLVPDARRKALAIPEALREAEDLVRRGETDPDAVRSRIERTLTREGLAVDYVAVVDATSLEPVPRVAGDCLVALAATVEGVRLIDNCLLLPSPLNQSQ